MAMIEIKNLNKWYGNFQVLKNCNVTVEKGEVVVVCGPSGSGKSTLIKTVNALEPSRKVKSSLTASPSAIRKQIFPSCAVASAWYSSTLNSSRTFQSRKT